MNETEQTTEVNNTTTQPNGAEVQHREVSRSTQISGLAIVQRVIWFIVGAIDVLIAIRFALLLLGANQSAGFVDFIYGITGIFVSPFVGIFGEPTYGSFMFEWSSILAILVYTLIGWGIIKLVTLTRPQDQI